MERSGHKTDAVTGFFVVAKDALNMTGCNLLSIPLCHIDGHLVFYRGCYLLYTKVRK